MRKLTLSQGKPAIVDDDVYDDLAMYKWSCMSTGYAYRATPGGRKHILMHRVIMDAKPGQEVDHISGNRLDNRRSNLRVCKPSENKKNRSLNLNSKSGFKGVCRRITVSGWLNLL